MFDNTPVSCDPGIMIDTLAHKVINDQKLSWMLVFFPEDVQATIPQFFDRDPDNYEQFMVTAEGWKALIAFWYQKFVREYESKIRNFDDKKTLGDSL